jgi:flagellar basal-body rod protein FlgF
MENTLYISLSRQTGLWNQLDMTANNLANVNTPGYKKVEPVFTEYLSKSTNTDRLMKDRLSYVHDMGIMRHFTEGALTATGNPLDIAIHEDGFFVLETENGARYTRNGQFKLNPDGMLTDAYGNAVLDNTNNPIFFAPTETQINIARDGTISTENGVVATLQIVDFADKRQLKATGNGMFATTAGNPAREVAQVNVEQGMIEQSNVQSVVEMTNMIKLQRAYENVQKMIDSEFTRRQVMIKEFARAGGR